MEKRPLILAVHDEESMLNLLRANLSLDEYDVVTANSGISALKLLEEYEPDLVILDTTLLGFDDFQVLDLILQRCNVPVIILANRKKVATLRDTLVGGAYDYMIKPFSIPKLTASVRAKLRRAEAEVTHC